jgi:hypothetical protein
MLGKRPSEHTNHKRVNYLVIGQLYLLVYSQIQVTFWIIFYVDMMLKQMVEVLVEHTPHRLGSRTQSLRMN